MGPLRRSAACLLLAGWLGLPLAQAESPVAPAQRRGVEQTLLTYPEWFLVHSPAEYADYVKGHAPHGFPFCAHVGQLWSSYRAVTGEQLRRGYELNPGYHLMIGVIASSTSVEYGLRSAYENSVGRVGWALGGAQQTEEDRFGAGVAQDYVDFIRREPWYRFDFIGQLSALWRDVPWWGPGLLRKWERRYALSTEYLLKAAYGWLIGMATGAVYDPAGEITQVVVDLPPLAPEAIGVQWVQRLPDGRVILNLPRYAAFRPAATALARQGVRLVDIAGNDSEILVSVWARGEVEIPVRGARVLFTQALLTRPGLNRIAVLVPVGELSDLLRHAAEYGLSVEHVYDY